MGKAKKQTTVVAAPMVRAEGPRSNKESNCGFFVWGSEWDKKRESLKRAREADVAGHR